MLRNKLSLRRVSLSFILFHWKVLSSTFGRKNGVEKPWILVTLYFHNRTKTQHFFKDMVMVMLTDKKPLSRAILDIRHPRTKIKTLPKAQRTRGLSSTYKINFFGSYHKFTHKSWSNIFRISTLHQHQNLNQTSPFRQNLNLKILTKPNQNFDQEWTS